MRGGEAVIRIRPFNYVETPDDRESNRNETKRNESSGRITATKCLV